jgi:4'-phosphopantetheinyl transferase
VTGHPAAGAGARDRGPTAPAGPSVIVHWASCAEVGEDDLLVLDAAERHRAGTYQRAADRRRFVGGASLLRRVVAAATSVAPQQVVVDRSCPRCARAHGRPTLPGTGLHVSVSHAADRIGVAVTGCGPVGLDVERAPRALGRRLRAGRRRQPDQAVDVGRWTRQESVVKATGDGITAELRAVAVTAPPDAPALLHYTGRPGLATWMSDLAPGRPYVGAVTVLTSDRPRLREVRVAASSRTL